MNETQGGVPSGIIGYTDDGEPIVTPTYRCGFFVSQKDSLCLVRECWYCKHTDFRRDTNVKLNHSICHCKEKRLLHQKQEIEVGTHSCHMEQ